MAEQLILVPEAVSDLTEAYRWYEERRTGLGGEFLRNVEACLESIQRHPEMYALAHENYRRALIRRFPYAIFYEFRDEVITVYALFHSAQDPNKWRVRLS